MLSKQLAPPHDNPLPQCVEPVLRRTDRLEAAALAPFPDVDDTPKSLDDARRLMSEAAAWARRIHWICSGNYDGKRQMHNRSNSLDGQFEFGIVGGGILYARDVLGTPPSFLGTGCSAAALTNLDEGGCLDPMLAGLDPLKNWSAIAHQLRAAHRTVFMQAFLIIDWVRERACAIENAVVPSLTVNAHANTVEVTLAGRTRIESLRPVHVTILEKWASEGIADVVSRTDMRANRPSALLHRVPELQPYVKMDRAANAKTADPANAGAYRLDKAARARLRVQKKR